MYTNKNMTAKLQAESIIADIIFHSDTKQLANSICDLIIKENESYYKLIDNRRQMFWKQVQQEIKNLKLIK